MYKNFLVHPRANTCSKTTSVNLLGGFICVLGIHYFFRDWMHFLAGLCQLCCRWLRSGGAGALCLGRVPCASVSFGSATLTAFLTSQETTGGGCRGTAWDTTTHLHNGWTLDIFSRIYRVKPFCLWDWISLCVEKYSQEKWLSPSAGLSYCPGSSLERGWHLVQFIGIEIRMEKKIYFSRSNTDLNRRDAGAEIRLWGWIPPSVVRAVKPSSHMHRLF